MVIITNMLGRTLGGGQRSSFYSSREGRPYTYISRPKSYDTIFSARLMNSNEELLPRDTIDQRIILSPEGSLNLQRSIWPLSMNILQHSQQQNYLSVKDLKKTLSQNRIKGLNNFIEFREIVPNEISDFLETNVNLVSLIEFSIPVIKNFFPQNKLIAEILSPPESDNADQRIVIYIRTNLSVKETLERIKEIDKKCGEYVYDSSGRKLLIMEEFE